MIVPVEKGCALLWPRLHRLGCEMTPIIVVGRAGPFCRNHGGPERMVGGTFLGKGGTLMWLLQPPQDLATHTNSRLFGVASLKIGAVHVKFY